MASCRPAMRPMDKRGLSADARGLLFSTLSTLIYSTSSILSLIRGIGKFSERRAASAGTAVGCSSVADDGEYCTGVETERPRPAPTPPEDVLVTA